MTPARRAWYSPRGPRLRGVAPTVIALLLAGVLVGGDAAKSTAREQPRHASATASNAASPGAPSFVLKARSVYPVTPDQPGPIAGGMVIVRDGRIAAVGRDLPLPPELPVIELRDDVVCPGFVSAASGLAGAHRGTESVSGAYQALDAFDNYADYTMVLARGTTTAHLDPGSHRLVSGIGAVVKLAGPPAERVLVPLADVTVNLGVFDPPLLYEPPFVASSDVAIEPSTRQRPDSRLGQYLELEERIAAAEAWRASPDSYSAAKFDLHVEAFLEAWAAGLPLRVQAQRATDIEGALALLERLPPLAAGPRRAYLTGLTEGRELPERLRTAGLPLVLRIDASYRHPAPDLGPDPEVLAGKLSTAGALTSGDGKPRLALAGPLGEPEDLRLTAALAVRGGMSPAQALAAITRVPAEIVGVDARVGSLAPGKDADLLVLSGDPLDISSHVRRVYVGGQIVFEPPPTDAVVVKAGTIWVGDGSIVRDGAVLIEHGKIQAVGPRVPHPPFAHVIDAGRDGFLTPGFIDAQGHLGLAGDRTPAGPDTPLHRAFAAAGREFVRVARAGVTTVVVAPYQTARNGGRLTAIKTFGLQRSELVARETGGVKYSLRGADPLTGVEPLRKQLQAGQKYVEQWKKYEEELAKWKAGELKEAKPKPEGQPTTEPEKPDPITGRWELTLSGDPLPQTVTTTMTLKLTGASIEGRVSDPTTGQETNLGGTLDGNQVTLEVEQETPLGRPTLKATLDREDHMAGHLVVGEFRIQADARRTDKGPVEFKVQHKRKRSKDGRPEPPKVDENLEPLRALLAGKVPAVVDVQTAAQVDAAIKLFVEEFKVPLVLIGAEDAADAADRILAHKDQVGVVVPTEITRSRAWKPYTQIAELSRRGIPVALQSNSEDGARNLPLMGLYAVQQGLGGDDALRALTVDAARMYRLDDRVGTLAPGKDADVLLFTGHPFDSGSRLERVLVGGREVPDE